MINTPESHTSSSVGTFSYEQIRFELIAKREVALLDVREEASFAEGHPLFAANLPLSRLETEAYTRIPRRDTLTIVFDNGEGFASIAAQRLQRLGYTQIYLLDGGLEGWRAAGGEIFQDVNSASKAFGELVESQRHTPSLSAEEVGELIESQADIVVLDVRRFDEYHTMSIPSGISVPGAELVLRVRELAPRPETRVIINCAGRTRSIIGTQSLVNAGIPNPVSALRNGTIGWTLAGQTLEHGQTRRFGDVKPENYEQALSSSRDIADRAGVKRTDLVLLKGLLTELNRTNYCFDVRTELEYKTGHLKEFRSAPGGQLVQETDHFAPVRGARIILFDLETVRANMTGSWLAQMGWEVYVVDGVLKTDLTEYGPEIASLPPLPVVNHSQIIQADTLADWLGKNKKVVIVDLSTAAHYIDKHIPGAWFALRSQLGEAIQNLPKAKHYVLTSSDGTIARFAYPEFRDLVNSEVYVLDKGNAAWVSAGLPVEKDEVNSRFASPRTDRYKRPYEGTNNAAEAMQAYLDWEYGLVEQLRRDGTHGFFVI